MKLKQLLTILLMCFCLDLFGQTSVIEIKLNSSPSPVRQAQTQLRVQLKNTSAASLFLPPSSMSLEANEQKVGYYFVLAQQEQYAAKQVLFWKNQLKALADRPIEDASKFAQLRLVKYDQNALATYTQLCRDNLSLAKQQHKSMKLYLETYRLAAGEQLIFFIDINSQKQAVLEFLININGKLHKAKL